MGAEARPLRRSQVSVSVLVISRWGKFADPWPEFIPRNELPSAPLSPNRLRAGGCCLGGGSGTVPSHRLGLPQRTRREKEENRGELALVGCSVWFSCAVTRARRGKQSGWLRAESTGVPEVLNENKEDLGTGCLRHGCPALEQSTRKVWQEEARSQQCSLKRGTEADVSSSCFLVGFGFQLVGVSVTWVRRLWRWCTEVTQPPLCVTGAFSCFVQATGKLWFIVHFCHTCNLGRKWICEIA